ncbi:hypothetical protein IJZ97_01360 [bacterium]|nr:hypothetical protein [bacterium]
MEFIKKLFKDDDKIIGLCGFKKEEELRVYIPKLDPSKMIYSTNYNKNFFLL